MSRKHKSGMARVITAFLSAALAVLVVGCTATSTSAGSSGSSESSATGDQPVNGESTDAAAPSADATSGESNGELPVASAVSIPAPATVPVTPAGGGDINQTVAAGEQTTLAPMPLVAAVDVDDQVSAQVTAVERIDATGRLPGELSGPALAVHVTLANKSGGPLDVSGVTVSLQDSAGTPAIPVTGDLAKSFAGSLDAGASGDAVYVFGLPDSAVSPFTVSVNPSADAPVALFVGDVQ